MLASNPFRSAMVRDGPGDSQHGPNSRLAAWTREMRVKSRFTFKYQTRRSQPKLRDEIGSEASEGVKKTGCGGDCKSRSTAAKPTVITVDV